MTWKIMNMHFSIISDMFNLERKKELNEQEEEDEERRKRQHTHPS